MLCVAKHGSLMSNEYIFFGGNIKIICKGLTLFMHGMVRNQLLIDLSFKQTAQWKLEIFNGLNSWEDLLMNVLLMNLLTFYVTICFMHLTF